MHVRLTSTMVFLSVLAGSTSFQITLNSSQAMAAEGKPYTLTCRISEPIGSDPIQWTVRGKVFLNTQTCYVEPSSPELFNHLFNLINPRLNCSSKVHDVTILVTQQLNRTQWTCSRYGQPSQPFTIIIKTTTSIPITNTVSRSSSMGSKTSSTTDHKTTTDVGSSRQGSISMTELVTGLQLNTYSDTKTTMRTETLPQDRINSRKTIIIAVGSSAGVVLVVVVVVVVVCCLKRRKLSAQDGSGLMRQESQNFVSSRSSPKGNFRDNSLVMADNVIYEGASQVGVKSRTRPVDATAMDPRSNQVLSVDDLYAKP